MNRAPEPGNASERGLLLGWLAFQRDSLAARCEGLTDEQLVTRSAPPSDLSLLGLVRHLTEMEHTYLVLALAGDGSSSVYNSDEAPDADIRGLRPDMVAASMARWHDERRLADQLISATGPLGAAAKGNRFSIRWNLVKVIGEYARHNGHANLIRERIDGATGEQTCVGCPRRSMRQKMFDSIKQLEIWLRHSTVDTGKVDEDQVP